MACGVILSGGLSRRFQVRGEPWTDKALYRVGNEPMIKLVYNAVSQVADKVVIAVNNPDRAMSYKSIILNANYVIDDERFKGPLAGIYSALNGCDEEYVIIVPNDMPYITPNTLKPLIDELRNFDVTTYIYPNGHLENALMAVRRTVTLQFMNLLANYGRSKIFDLIRGLPKALFLNPLVHGVELKSLMNVNTRDDLINVNVDVHEQVIKGDVSIVREYSINDVLSKRLDRIMGSLWYTLITGDPWPEFRLYTEAGLHFLAAHVLLDSVNENVKQLGRRILASLGVDKA
ncbi:molybdenum cofactor guanylyltransferase [Vulcanisaeta distributa]|uniref:Molybdenum cofactor guanylyltransferase n=1 Tax=Vulcanisaeta distributa (strain DSM 14429 / JCM 11212 / NBRC 100878 / IC-017) TaxID=572478 RepID=E1QP97_VULDI|nr:molybdenum cofactor guanylyltransferase [Vulcanisaeta distributa]ADN50268.1 molybdenum cofactor guanylyltransferase [Vulcanisaeta distributa DSM 14429]